MAENLPANTGDIGNMALIPGSEISPRGGNGNPLQYLAQKIPWTEEPGRLQFSRIAESDTTE